MATADGFGEWDCLEWFDEAVGTCEDSMLIGTASFLGAIIGEFGLLDCSIFVSAIWSTFIPSGSFFVRYEAEGLKRPSDTGSLIPSKVGIAGGGGTVGCACSSILTGITICAMGVTSIASSFVTSLPSTVPSCFTVSSSCSPGSLGLALRSMGRLLGLGDPSLEGRLL